MPSGPPRDLNITNAHSNSLVVKLNQTEPSDLNGIFTQFKFKLIENCRNGSVNEYEFFTLASNVSTKDSNQAPGNSSLSLGRRRRRGLPSIPSLPAIPEQAINQVQNTLNNLGGVLNNTLNSVLNGGNGTNSNTAQGSSLSNDLQAVTHMNITELKLGLKNAVYFDAQHDSFEILISGLLPYTFYNISIAACTKLGCGPYAHQRERTDQSGK